MFKLIDRILGFGYKCFDRFEAYANK